jgi:anti-sigma factor RsiW
MVRRNPEDAERTLRAYFASSLDEAARTEEPLAFDEIAAYVDGQLDEVDREIFESRLDMNPTLRAEVDDLMAMRAAMAAEPARVRRRASSSSMVWALGALAAAASLTVAVVWVAKARLQQSSADGQQTSTQQAAAPTIPLQTSLLDAGGVIGVDAAGTLVAAPLPALPADQARDAIAALQRGTLPPAALPRDLRGAGLITLMGERDPRKTTFGVIAPLATVVRDTRPTFRWRPQPKTFKYSVTIYNDRFEEVARSHERITGTSWTCDVDLAPGVTYQWQVSAIRIEGTSSMVADWAPRPPDAEARFRILDADHRQSLDRQLVDAGSSNLLRGLAFIRAGTLDDAEAAFSALAAANPKSPLPHDLLENARRLRDQPTLPHK